MEQRRGQLQNLCCPDLMPLRCEYIIDGNGGSSCAMDERRCRHDMMIDGKDYQRGSIEKNGNRQRNSETIQDEEITISRPSNKT